MRDADGLERRLLASVSRGEGRRHLLDGGPADPATLARNRPPVAVFAPDRLTLVKGPPSERRAHVDGFLAARWPARGELRKRYGQALAQRNALLSRLAAGHSARAELDAWDASLAEAAAPLVAARDEAIAELADLFAAAAAELGLEGGATLEYAPRATGAAEEIRDGPGGAPRPGPAAGAQLLGPAPGRVQDRRLPGARCGATGPRASSGRRCLRFSSPSARR